jgi:CBS domain-containing protein
VSGVSDGVCKNERVERAGAGALRVRDAMVAKPKTLPAAATVDDLRRLFTNGHVVTALLVDGDRFAGAIDRDELPADADGRRPARELARVDVATIGPDAPLSEALSHLDERGERRLVVVDEDGLTLRGLLCLTSDRDGFCQS